MIERQRQIHVFIRLYCLGIWSFRRLIFGLSVRFS
jgi:hypothetical protein